MCFQIKSITVVVVAGVGQLITSITRQPKTTLSNIKLLLFYDSYFLNFLKELLLLYLFVLH